MKTSTPLARFLSTRGEPFAVQRNYRFFVQDTTCIYYIIEGQIDLFTVELREEWDNFTLVPKLAAETNLFIGDFMGGPLSFICAKESGKVLFPFPLQKFQIHETKRLLHVIGKAARNTVVRKIRVVDLWSFLAAHPEAEIAFSDIFSEWQHCFQIIYNAHYLHKVDQFLPLSPLLTIPAETTFAVPHLQTKEESSSVWLKIHEGTAALFDSTTTQLDPKDPPFPLVSKIWIKGETPLLIETFVDNAWSHNRSLWEGCLNFHRLLLQNLQDLLALKKQKGQWMIFQKETQQNVLFDASIHQLGAIFQNQPLFNGGSISDDPLYRACEIVAHSIDLKIKIPYAFNGTTSREKIQEICTESNIFHRTLMLTGNWWRSSGSYFVGFVGALQRPVALLPTLNERYLMVESVPESGTLIQQIVDAELATEIAPLGVMFYRSFPFNPTLSLKDLLTFCLKGKGPTLWSILALNLFQVILILFIPFATQVIFDVIIPQHDIPLFWQILAGMTLAIVGKSLLNLISEYMLMHTWGSVLHDSTTALWERLLCLPANFFRRYSVGDLMGRADGTIELQRLLSVHTVLITLNLVFSLFFLLAMFYYDTSLTFIGILIAALCLGVNFYALYKGSLLENSIRALWAHLNAHSIEMTLGISKIRTAGAEKRIFAWLSEGVAALKKKEYALGNLRLVTSSINSALFGIASFAIFWAFLVFTPEHARAASLGSFLAFYTAFNMFIGAIANFGGSTLMLTPIYTLINRSKVLVEEPMEFDPNKHTLETLTGDVRLDHVTFSYSKEAPPLLQDISIVAEPGEFIALVGPTGSGKSTVMRLLLGFEKPEQGAVYYGGKDLTQINAQQVRRQMGVVLQTSQILEGSIKENVARGRFVTENEILKALDRANFTEDLRQLGMGIETILSNFGAGISGGQKQRILIASAIIGTPRILLMDEATNALDSISQAKITQTLDQLNITRIVVAHRLSTVVHADRIYVMDKGCIVQQGTYQSLLEDKAGLFADLAKRQKLI